MSDAGSTIPMAILIGLLHLQFKMFPDMVSSVMPGKYTKKGVFWHL